MKSRTPFGALMIFLAFFGCLARAAPTAAGYSATTLYNQGNSFARAGKPGMAVLNYERARLLAPNDPDVAANLRLVRDNAHLPAYAPSWFERTGLMADSTVLAWTGVLGLMLAGAGVLGMVLAVGSRWLRGLALLGGIALMGVTLGNALVLWPILHEAVVLDAATPVRVTPAPMGDPAFMLPEAETVRITAEHADFVLVRTRAGRTGWVARANLAAVVPPR